jgi:colanic acid/amylovoran biosynthesis glycosyltransferase
MKIAYLAPELPALSATFVYNEILQLELLATEVVPFSVHAPNPAVDEPRVAELADRTVHLYSQSIWRVLKSNIVCLVGYPIRYVKTLRMLCKDMWSVGLLSRTGLGLGYRFLFSAVLAKQLIEKKCDHLHVHFAHIPTDIAMYASSLSSVPFSVTAHANDIYERGWLLKEKVERSSFFATISDFNKQYLAAKGVDIAKVSIVRCGVDPAQFSQKSGLANNQLYRLGVIARLVEKKGIDTLLNAMVQLKEQGQSVELLIAGSGPLEDSLKSLSDSLGLTKKEVTFLGSIPHAEVAAFMQSLDAFVLPCREDANGDIDGIPVVLMEAMLMGVPVITSKLSGIPELVINQQTGLLVKPNDSDELASAVLSMMGDDKLRERMCAGAVSRVKSEFSLIVNTKILHGMFSAVINGNK